MQRPKLKNTKQQQWKCNCFQLQINSDSSDERSLHSGEVVMELDSQQALSSPPHCASQAARNNDTWWDANSNVMMLKSGDCETQWEFAEDSGRDRAG